MADYSQSDHPINAAPPVDAEQQAQPSPASLVADPEQRITSLSKSEALKLKQRMVRSDKYMQRTFKSNYDRCYRLWMGRHWREQQIPSPDHRVVVNYLAPIIQTKVDSIAFNPVPDFILRPLTEASAGNAEIATQALKYEWRRASAARETKRALFDKELFGFGVVQTGWEFVTDEVELFNDRRPVEGEPPDAEDVTEAILAGKDPADTEPPVPAAKVRKDQFWVRRINPKDFRIDPEATWVIEDAAFIGYVEERPLDELKKDKRYRNTRQLKGNNRNLAGYLDEVTLKMADELQPSDIKRVRLHHYYEKRRRLHCVFVDEHNLPLLVEQWQWKQDRYPFRAIFSPLAMDSFYPEQPSPILLEPMQREINETRSQIHIHRRRYNRKYQCKRGVLDAQAKKQLRQAADGLVIEHNGQNPNDIVPLQDAPLQPEVYEADKIARQDIITLSAIDQYQMGMTPSKRMTTTEVEQVSQSGGARVQADAQAFEEFCAGVAHDCLDWLEQFAVMTRELPIYGPDQDVTGWGTFSAKDIQGDYFVEVYMGSTMVKDSATEVKDIGFLLQNMMSFFQMPDPMNPGQPMAYAKPLLQQLLRAIPEIRNVKEILQPPAPPPPPFAPPGLPGAPPGPTGPGGPGGPGEMGGPVPGPAMEALAAMRAGMAPPAMSNGTH